MRIISHFIFNYIILIFLMGILCVSMAAEARAEDDLSSLAYQTVYIIGKLENIEGKLIVGGKIQVDWNSVRPFESDGQQIHGTLVEMVGVLYSVSKDKMPFFKPLRIKLMKGEKFYIEKYDRPIEIKGMKPKVIHQHPIAGSNPFIDYFDCALGQIVVYFENERDYQAYNSLEALSNVTLEGTLFPAFAYSKRPGSGEKKEKLFYGFQMSVKKVIVDGK